MEFLRSFLLGHFAGKPMCRDVSWFLRPVFLGETLSRFMFASICGIYRGTSNSRNKVFGPDNCGNGSSARNKSKEVKTVPLLNTWCNAFFFILSSCHHCCPPHGCLIMDYSCQAHQSYLTFCFNTDFISALAFQSRYRCGNKYWNL